MKLTPLKRLLLGLVLLGGVSAANFAMCSYFVPSLFPPSGILKSALLGGPLLVVGALAYAATWLVARIFLAGRQASNPHASDSELRKFSRSFVPAISSFIWIMVGMVALTLVTTPIVVGLVKLLSHRAA